MRPIAALLSRFGHDGASEPGHGAKTEPSAGGSGPDGSRGQDVTPATPDETGAGATDRRDGDGRAGADAPDGRSDPTHVCAICRSSFGHAPTSCPDCGNTAVTPLEDWESSELIRRMSGGG